MKDQTIFKRYELKYLLTDQQYAAINEGISSHMIPDPHGHGRIQSLYYDTPTFLLARRSLDKPLYKEKLRLRSYGIASEDTDIFLEIKKKYDGVTYKRRVGLSYDDSKRFLSSNEIPDSNINFHNQQITSEIRYFLTCYENICPAFLLQYERDAFYSKELPDFRVTFDENITWRHDNLCLDDGFYGTKILPENTFLMEVKVGAGMPCWFVDLLTQNQIYRTSFSKYGKAYLDWRQNNDSLIK